jgi:hypothetical protein
MLETRLVPASCSVSGSTLNINAGKGQNTIALIDTGTGAPGNLAQTIIDGELCLDGKGKNKLTNVIIGQVNVSTGGSSDNVTYTLQGQQQGTMSIEVDLGGGSDTFTTNIEQNVVGSLELDIVAKSGSAQINMSYLGFVQGKLTLNSTGKGSAPITYDVTLFYPYDSSPGTYTGTINGKNSSKATLSYNLNNQLPSWASVVAQITSGNKNNTCLYNKGVVVSGQCNSNPSSGGSD